MITFEKKCSDELSSVLKQMYTLEVREFNVYHLLCVIFNDKACSAYKTITSLISKDMFNVVNNELFNYLASSLQSNGNIIKDDLKHSVSNDLNLLIKEAENVCSSMQHSEVNTNHILIALGRIGDNKYDFLNRLEIKEKDIQQFMELRHTNVQQKSLGVKKKYTEPFSHNVAKKYNGREKELHSIISALCKKNSQNVIIVGEHGVGKTSVVEMIDKKIKCGEVPNLKQYEIIQLSINDIISGCSLKGMIEERISSVIKFFIENKGRYVILIEDIHHANVASQENNIIPLIEKLCRIEKLPIVATTTPSGYHSFFEQNKQLTTTFTKINLSEMCGEDIRMSVYDEAERLGEYHSVEYTDEIIEYSIKMAKKHLSTALPTSAIEILDYAGGSTYNRQKMSDEAKEFTKRLEELKTEKAQCVIVGQFEKISSIDEEISTLNHEIELLEASDCAKKKYLITKDDINSSISLILNNDEAMLNDDELSKIKVIESMLTKKVIGQDHAVHEMCKSLKRNAVGLSRHNKTIGSYLLIGPTGCGKTLIAKTIAEELFGSAKKLLKIDMSEFSEPSSLAKLIGAAPGYVGCAQGGRLTESVKHNKRCVLLLDEIEKANEDVINAFLQVMDDGILTDGFGNVTDFSNVMIIMTSNVGMRTANENSHTVGFKSVDKFDDVAKSEMKKFFSPEFLNRLDNVIYFNKLTKGDLSEIVSLELQKLKERCEDINFNLSFADGVVEEITELAATEIENGARPIIRIIQDKVEMQIVDSIADGENSTTIAL